MTLSLWNAAADGTLVGSAQHFEGIELVEGRFAVEPDFGPDAFNGSKRWIEIAFRSPSGVGDFVTLTPRQAVNAVPYALYALNGRIGPEGPQGEPGDDRWTLDAGTGDISFLDGRVGIGTDQPAALLHVGDGTTGDDTVMLPDSSVSDTELLGALARSEVLNFGFSGEPGQYNEGYEEVVVEANADGVLNIIGQATLHCVSLDLNGQSLDFGNQSFTIYRTAVSKGDLLVMSATHNCYISGSSGGSYLLLFTASP